MDIQAKEPLADGRHGTIQKDTLAGEVLQEHHYYPFGLEWTGDWHQYPDPQDQANAYRYNGKELHSEVLKKLDEVDVTLGWYSYGARFYDATIGKFTSVDPRAEKYPGWSPYNYVLGNPIGNIDPQGDTVRIGIGDQFINYTPGMEYQGKDQFVSSIVSTLNNLNSTESGSVVLNTLITSDNNFDLVNQAPDEKGAGAAFSPSEDGGGL